MSEPTIADIRRAAEPTLSWRLGPPRRVPKGVTMPFPQHRNSKQVIMADDRVTLSADELAAMRAQRQTIMLPGKTRITPIKVIAHRIGVPESTFLHWECGLRRPPLARYRDWCRVIGFPPHIAQG